MLPTTSVPSVIPPPASLVNTSIVGSTALRPPSDTVAPPVSNAQITNNSRGNGGAGPSAVSQSAPSVFSDMFPGVPSFGTGTGIISGATAFFTQLLSQAQDAPAFLAVYEKMQQLSQVRYKPSNATLPPPEPAGVYGRLLQQEKQIREVVAVRSSEAAYAADDGTAAATVGSLPLPRPAREVKTSSDQPSLFGDDTVESEVIALPVITPVPRANNAYATSVLRTVKPDNQTVESA